MAANGAKALFDRVPQTENKKFRKLALTTASQQNLASCIALLKEVAAHYGFILDIKEGTILRNNLAIKLLQYSM